MQRLKKNIFWWIPQSNRFVSKFPYYDTKNEAKKVNKNNALVAQLDRALDYESRGQGFESSRAHHMQFTFGFKIKFN